MAGTNFQHFGENLPPSSETDRMGDADICFVYVCAYVHEYTHTYVQWAETGGHPSYHSHSQCYLTWKTVVC